MQWEYRIIAVNSVDGSEGERTLNELGTQGWELVIQVPPPHKYSVLPRWILKRQVIGSRLA